MPRKKESEIIKKEYTTFNKNGFSPTKLTYEDLYPESYEYTPPQSYTNLKKFFDHKKKHD